MIKEEIKSFLANRRISQAVVAQVTGAYHQLHLHSRVPDDHHKGTAGSTLLLPLPPFLFQGSVRVGSPTGSCSRGRTSASRRNGPSSAGTSWRRPAQVTHH